MRIPRFTGSFPPNKFHYNGAFETNATVTTELDGISSLGWTRSGQVPVYFPMREFPAHDLLDKFTQQVETSPHVDKAILIVNNHPDASGRIADCRSRKERGTPSYHLQISTKTGAVFDRDFSDTNVRQTLTDGLGFISKTLTDGPLPPPLPLSPEESRSAQAQVVYDNRRIALVKQAIQSLKTPLPLQVSPLKPQPICASVRPKTDAGNPKIPNILDAQGTLQWIEKYGYTQTTAILKAINGIDVNKPLKHSDIPPIVWAALRNEPDIVQALLQADGIDINQPNKFGETALIEAARQGFTDVVKILLADPRIEVNKPNQSNRTALMEAAGHGHIDVVEALLTAKGVEVNTQATNGATALNNAARNGHLNAVNALLAVDGIAVNTREQGGYTALGLAMSYNRPDVVRALLAVKGLEINKRRPNEEPPLIWAIRNGHHDIVKTLLAIKGLEVNQRNYAGNTTLTWAVIRNNTEAVKSLLAVPGIEVDPQTLTEAKQAGNPEVITLLKNLPASAVITGPRSWVPTWLSLAFVKGNKASDSQVQPPIQLSLDVENQICKSGHSIVAFEHFLNTPYLPNPVQTGADLIKRFSASHRKDQVSETRLLSNDSDQSSQSAAKQALNALLSYGLIREVPPPKSQKSSLLSKFSLRQHPKTIKMFQLTETGQSVRALLSQLDFEKERLAAPTKPVTLPQPKAENTPPPEPLTDIEYYARLGNALKDNEFFEHPDRSIMEAIGAAQFLQRPIKTSAPQNNPASPITGLSILQQMQKQGDIDCGEVRSRLTATNGINAHGSSSSLGADDDDWMPVPVKIGEGLETNPIFKHFGPMYMYLNESALGKAFHPIPFDRTLIDTIQTLKRQGLCEVDSKPRRIYEWADHHDYTEEYVLRLTPKGKAVVDMLTPPSQPSKPKAKKKIVAQH